MTVTKRDLVLRIGEETGLIHQQVADVVQKTLDAIREALAQGDDVELRKFGVFEIKVRKARVGRNPKAPAAKVVIPQRVVVKFKPGKDLRGEVSRIPPEVVLARKQAAKTVNADKPAAQVPNVAAPAAAKPPKPTLRAP
jgi:nucleoid DNA-binding protein